MSRSNLGPIPDEAWDQDIPNNPNLDKEYGEASHARMDKLMQRFKEQRASHAAANKKQQEGKGK